METKTEKIPELSIDSIRTPDEIAASEPNSIDPTYLPPMVSIDASADKEVYAEDIPVSFLSVDPNSLNLDPNSIRPENIYPKTTEEAEAEIDGYTDEAVAKAIKGERKELSTIETRAYDRFGNIIMPPITKGISFIGDICARLNKTATALPQVQAIGKASRLAVDDMNRLNMWTAVQFNKLGLYGTVARSTSNDWAVHSVMGVPYMAIDPGYPEGVRADLTEDEVRQIAGVKELMPFDERMKEGIDVALMPYSMAAWGKFVKTTLAATLPVEGAMDKYQTFGQMMADNYYKHLAADVGSRPLDFSSKSDWFKSYWGAMMGDRPAVEAWALQMDMAFETMAGAPGTTKKVVTDIYRTLGRIPKPLTVFEKLALSQIYEQSAIDKLAKDPLQARLEISFIYGLKEDGKTLSDLDIAKSIMGRGAFAKNKSTPLASSFDDVRPVSERQAYEMTLDEFLSERPAVKGYLYHGSPSGDILEFDPYYASAAWREGLGPYATDSRDMAKGYAMGRTSLRGDKEAAKAKGKINYVKSDATEVLDMDAPVDEALWNSLLKKYDMTTADFAEPAANNMDAMNDVRYLIQEDIGSSPEAVDIVEDFLRSKFHATTHMEGVKSGKPHRVHVFKGDSYVETTPSGEKIGVNTLKIKTVPPRDVYEEAVRNAVAANKLVPVNILEQFPEAEWATTAIQKIKDAPLILAQNIETGKEILKPLAESIVDDIIKKEADITATRSVRGMAAETAMQEGTGLDAVIAALREMKGSQYTNVSTVDVSHITPEQWEAMVEAIKSKGFYDGGFVAGNALLDLRNGKIPIRSGLDALSEVFGQDIFEPLKKLPKSLQMVDIFDEAMSTSRILMTAFDNSGLLRQGDVVLKTKDIELWLDAAKVSYKSLGSQEYYDAFQYMVKYSEAGFRYKKHNLIMSGIGSFTPREEFAAKNFIERIPVLGKGVVMSERGYVNFVNSLRANVFDYTVTKLTAQGKVLSDADLDSLASWIMHLTGRGNPSEAVNSLNKMLGYTGKAKDVMPPSANAVLFAPRYAISKVQMVTDLFTSTPLIQKEVAATLATYYRTNLMMLHLASNGEQLFGWEVDTDPKSSNYGMIDTKDGIKYNLWGPNKEFINFYARLISGEYTDPVTGEEIKDGRISIATDWLSQKLSPGASAILGLAKGEEFDGTRIPDTLEGKVSFVARKTTIPIIVQELYSAYVNSESTFNKVGASVFAFNGGGIAARKPGSYQKVKQLRDNFAIERFGKRFHELTGRESLECVSLMSVDIPIQNAMIDAQYDTFLDNEDIMIKEQYSNDSIVRSLEVKNSTILAEKKVNIRGVTDRISIEGNNIKLTEEAYEDMLLDISTTINKLMNMITIDQPREVYNEIVNESIDYAKQKKIEQIANDTGDTEPVEPKRKEVK